MVQMPYKADFCLEVSFKKGSGNPSRIFQSITELIDACQEIDKNLARSVDVQIEPVLILEDIQAGSFRVWLRTFLKEIPDETLKNLNWKPIVGQYLVEGKYLLLDFLQDRERITGREELKKLQGSLLELAEDTEVRKIPTYTPITLPRIASGIRKVSEAMSYLEAGDSAKYITKEKEVTLNPELQLSQESLEELLTKESIINKNVLILKVKKPDFLADSMWEFKHGRKTIPVKILDAGWLYKFQTKEIHVQPGDSIRANVEVETKYGYDDEVIAVHFNVTKVLEVIPQDTQENLF